MISFTELCQKANKTDAEKTLLMAVAILATHPNFSHLHPSDVLDRVVETQEQAENK